MDNDSKTIEENLLQHLSDVVEEMSERTDIIEEKADLAASYSQRIFEDQSTFLDNVRESVKELEQSVAESAVKPSDIFDSEEYEQLHNRINEVVQGQKKIKLELQQINQVMGELADRLKETEREED